MGTIKCIIQGTTGEEMTPSILKKILGKKKSKSDGDTSQRQKLDVHFAQEVKTIPIPGAKDPSLEVEATSDDIDSGGTTEPDREASKQNDSNKSETSAENEHKDEDESEEFKTFKGYTDTIRRLKKQASSTSENEE